MQNRATNAQAVFVLGRGDRWDVVSFLGGVNFGLFAIAEGGSADEHVFVEFDFGVVVVVELEVDFEFFVELERCFKGLVEAGFEATERADDSFGQEFACLVHGEFAGSDVFFEREFAIESAAFESCIGLFEFGRAALRAGGLEVGKCLAFGGFGMGASFVNDLAGVGLDLVHEVIAAEVTLLHLAQFVFPIAGERG